MAKYDELVKEYRRLAKQADQRLVRLEKLAAQEHYKGVLSYSYARAQKDIASWQTGATQKAPRFNTAPPKNTQQLEAKIADIKSFLEAPTSTKRGITSIYQKRANTTNERYGTNLTWQELANYYESELSKKLASKYGSKTLIQAIGLIKLEDSPDDIREANEKIKHLQANDVVLEVTEQLRKQGLTAEQLFGE